MSDYISRQVAIRAIKDHINFVNTDMEGYNMARLHIMELIEVLPPADVVDVVRCKDCKHYKRNVPCVGGHYNGCDEWLDEGNPIIVYDNDFCSYGERADT